jgi:hypothetical protein
MKLYIVVGRINGQLAFACDEFYPNIQGTKVSSSDTDWRITAFATVRDAAEYHDGMKHGIAKHCRVVEIEIPDE